MSWIRNVTAEALFDTGGSWPIRRSAIVTLDSDEEDAIRAFIMHLTMVADALENSTGFEGLVIRFMQPCRSEYGHVMVRKMLGPTLEPGIVHKRDPESERWFRFQPSRYQAEEAFDGMYGRSMLEESGRISGVSIQGRGREEQGMTHATCKILGC